MRKWLALILLSCVLYRVATAQKPEQPALTIGTATAVTGQTATGFIEVSAGSDVGTNIPVAVIRGPKPGLLSLALNALKLAQDARDHGRAIDIAIHKKN